MHNNLTTFFMSNTGSHNTLQELDLAYYSILQSEKFKHPICSINPRKLIIYNQNIYNKKRIKEEKNKTQEENLKRDKYIGKSLSNNSRKKILSDIRVK